MNWLLIFLTICTMCQSAAADIILDPNYYEKDQVVWFDSYDDRMVYCWETGEVFELELDTGKTKYLFWVDVLYPRQVHPRQGFHLSQAKQNILAVDVIFGQFSGSLGEYFSVLSFYDINLKTRTQCQIDDTRYLRGLGFLDSTNHYVCRSSKKIWIVDAVDCEVLASFDYSGEDSGLIKLSKDGDKYIYSSDDSTFIKTSTREVMWNKVYANLVTDASEDQHGRYDVIVYLQDEKFNVSKIFTFDTFKGNEIWSKENVSPHQLRAVSRDAKRQLFRRRDKLIIENVPLKNRFIVDTRISEVDASEVDAVFTINGDLLLLPELDQPDQDMYVPFFLKKRENNILTIVDSANGKVIQQWNLRKINGQEGQLKPPGTIFRKTFYLLVSGLFVLSLIVFLGNNINYRKRIKKLIWNDLRQVQ